MNKVLVLCFKVISLCLFSYAKLLLEREREREREREVKKFEGENDVWLDMSLSCHQQNTPL